MNIRRILLSMLLTLGFVATSTAVPVRYQIDRADFGTGQFTLDVPDTIPGPGAFTEILATDIDGAHLTLGVWTEVAFQFTTGISGLFRIDYGVTSIASGKGFPPNTSLLDAWLSVGSSIGIEAVDSSVPDGGATSVLLGIALTTMLIARRKTSADSCSLRNQPLCNSRCAIQNPFPLPSAIHFLTPLNRKKRCSGPVVSQLNTYASPTTSGDPAPPRGQTNLP